MVLRSTGGRAALFQPSPVFLAIFAVLALGGVLAWLDLGPRSFAVILFVLAGWLVSLSLHEYAHALLAYRGGDRSVAARGYLTLNPLKYTHPILSIALPLVIVLLGGIGLPGGAVWIDRHALRSKRRESLVSAAGPATNLVFAVVAGLPFLLGADTTRHRTFWAALALLAFLQLTAALLNLLPVPGVDGGAIVRPWLNREWSTMFDYIAPYGMLILFAVLWYPPLNAVFFDLVFWLGDQLRVDPSLYAEGFRLLQFWR